MVPGHPGVMQPGEVLHLHDEALMKTLVQTRAARMG